MNIKQTLFAAGLALSGILSACRMGHNDNTTGISIKNTDDVYQFSAYYNRNLTARIERYIDGQIKPSKVFNSKNHELDLTIILNDQTAFALKTAPGEISIKLDKRTNSQQGYERISKICQGIRKMMDNKIASAN